MKINPLWYICLLARFSMVLSVLYMFTIKNKYKLVDKLVYISLFVIGLLFIYKYITGSNNEVQIDKVFWHDSRIYHGILFILATYFYFTNKKNISSMILLIDIIFSFIYRITNKK